MMMTPVMVAAMPAGLREGRVMGMGMLGGGRLGGGCGRGLKAEKGKRRVWGRDQLRVRRMQLEAGRCERDEVRDVQKRMGLMVFLFFRLRNYEQLFLQYSSQTTSNI